MPKAPRLTAPEAEAMLLRAGFVWLRLEGESRADAIAEYSSTPTDPARQHAQQKTGRVVG